MIKDISEILNTIEKTLKEDYDYESRLLLTIASNNYFNVEVFDKNKDSKILSKEAISFIIASFKKSSIIDGYMFDIAFYGTTFDFVEYISDSNIDKYT